MMSVVRAKAKLRILVTLPPRSSHIHTPTGVRYCCRLQSLRADAETDCEVPDVYKRWTSVRGEGGSSTGQGGSQIMMSASQSLGHPAGELRSQRHPYHVGLKWLGPYTTDRVLLQKDVDPSEVGSAAEADSARGI